MRCDTIKNHKMKTRCFDHIDLRVTDIETAKNFYGKFLPQLGFVHEKPGRYHTFYSSGDGQPSEFFGFTRDEKHKPNNTRIAFWADTREEVDRIAKLVRDAGGKNLEGPEICKDYSPGYYAFFLKTQMATSSKFAAARTRYLPVEKGSARHSVRALVRSETNRRAEDCRSTVAPHLGARSPVRAVITFQLLLCGS